MERISLLYALLQHIPKSVLSSQMSVVNSFWTIADWCLHTILMMATACSAATSPSQWMAGSSSSKCLGS